MGEVKLTPTPPPGKTTLKKPSLIRVKKSVTFQFHVVYMQLASLMTSKSAGPNQSQVNQAITELLL